MKYKIVLVEGPALWHGKIFEERNEGSRDHCIFMSDEAERKGLAHQHLIDYCLAHGLDHQTMKVELLRWEGC